MKYYHPRAITLDGQKLSSQNNYISEDQSIKQFLMWILDQNHILSSAYIDILENDEKIGSLTLKHADIADIISRQSYVQEFISHHNKHHINYCEILIPADGIPIYARPSHLYGLLQLFGVDLNDIYYDTQKYQDTISMIPVDATPVEWLVESLNVACCWYDRVILPYNYSWEQLYTLKELASGKCVHENIEITISIEKSRIELKDQYKYDELKNLLNLRYEIQNYINYHF